MILSRSIIFRIRMFQTKYVEEIKEHILCSINFLVENCAIYEIMWKNVVEGERPQMTIWRMRFACWIPKAINTFSEYVILIAFPLQQWLQHRASMLRYTYIASLVMATLYYLDIAGGTGFDLLFVPDTK
jgi:hypothetical protein